MSNQVEIPTVFPAVTVTGVRRDRSTALVRGSHDVIVDGLIDSGVPFRWSRVEQGYVLSLNVVDRLFSAIEKAGHHVDWRQALW